MAACGWEGGPGGACSPSQTAARLQLCLLKAPEVLNTRLKIAPGADVSRIGDNGARTRGALQWLNSLWTHHISQGLPLQRRVWEALSPPKTFLLLPWGKFSALGIPPNLPPCPGEGQMTEGPSRGASRRRAQSRIPPAALWGPERLRDEGTGKVLASVPRRGHQVPADGGAPSVNWVPGVVPGYGAQPGAAPTSPGPGSPARPPPGLGRGEV